MNTFNLVVAIILAVSVFTSNVEAHDEADAYVIEDIQCLISTGMISLTVIMPGQLTDELKEQHAKSVCDSIQEESITPSDAVCDTDTNCMYYDEYKNFGIASVMVSHDDDKGMRWLSVTCNGDVKSLEPKIIDDPSELSVVCN